MSRFGTHYQIARPTGVCADTGALLEPGKVCVATLCERAEDEGFERRDFSTEAWAAGARPDRLFSFWRTTVREPGSGKKLLVDDEVLVELFMRLEDDERPQRVAFRFVLALILMRKKQLRFVGRKTREDETGADPAADAKPPQRWLLRRRGAEPDEPPIEVVDPHLTDDDVRDLMAQLGEILQGEL